MYPVRGSDVVFLQGFDRSGALARLLDAPVVDLKALLTACLDRAETRLRVVPEILAVRFPQHRDLLDDAAGEEAEEYLIWAQERAVENGWL